MSVSPKTGTRVRMPPTSSPKVGAPSTMTTMSRRAATAANASRLLGAYWRWRAPASRAVAARTAKELLPMPKKRAAVIGEYPSTLFT